jgi:hypothetical protein
MKNLITKIAFCLITALGFANLTLAQESSTSAGSLGRITITPYIPEQIEGLPAGAANMLSNKLNQLVSANGISGSGYLSRFIITPNIDVATKDILATAPPMTALTLNVNLYIGDGFDGKKYASHTVTVKGVGINENKAYMDAIKNIKPNDAGVQSFIASGKTKIIDFYNARCTQIINEANGLATQFKYEEAMFKLTSIPEECTECYNKTLTVIGPMFKKLIERDCKVKMADANSKWNANQSWETANEVGAILASIDPEASCYKDAKALNDKIGKRVLEIDKREWNYKLETEVNLKRDAIKAWRDVGVAFGNGQPKTQVYNIIGWGR